MKNLFTYILLSTCIYFISCKKNCHEDDQVDPCLSNYETRTISMDTCWKGNMSALCNSGFGVRELPFPDDYPLRYSIASCSVNPNNPYQICYKQDSIGEFTIMKTELKIYDFYTGKSKTIGIGYAGYPDWSSTGWIIFQSSDGYLHKINESGSEEIRLPCKASNAKWSPDGESFLAIGPTGKMLYDKNGNKINDIPFVSNSSYDWINDSLVIIYNEKERCFLELNVYNETINNYTKLQGDSMVHINNISTIDQTIYYSTYEHIGSFNYVNQTSKILFKQAESFNVGYVCPTPNKLLCMVLYKDTTYIDPCFYSTYSHLCVMDKDGTRPRCVKFEE